MYIHGEKNGLRPRKNKKLHEKSGRELLVLKSCIPYSLVLFRNVVNVNTDRSMFSMGDFFTYSVQKFREV